MMKMWKYLIGYDTFEDDYNNTHETRKLAQKGAKDYVRGDWGGVDFMD